jgi:hypothetical protein
MQIICPTCHGKGTINDPKAPSVLCYCGPNGETCPQVFCLTCGGIGWINKICFGLEAEEQVTQTTQERSQ